MRTSDFNDGVRWSIRDMQTYTFNPPPEAQVRVNGRTPLSRVEHLREQRIRAVRAVQVERHNALLADAIERRDDADETLNLLQEKLDSWLPAMRAGRMTPTEVIQNVSECPEIIEAVLHAYQTITDDAEAATAMVDQDPADYEASQIERFRVLADALPLVTESWLRGEPDAPDPLDIPRQADESSDDGAALVFQRTGRDGSQAGDQ